MPRKKPAAPGGAPEWVLTYGDMMSLLLCFFILLAALSELKREDHFTAVAEDVRKAIGKNSGSSNRDAGAREPNVSMIAQLTAMSKKKQPPADPNVLDPNVRGKQMEVQSLRQEQQYAIGAPIYFAPGSAQLDEESQKVLRDTAKFIHGYTNRIEVRGHASSMEQAQLGTFADLWELSFARSAAVVNFLTQAENGVDRQRLRISAFADTLPVIVRKYTADEQQPNRRVDIVVSNHLISEPPPLPGQPQAE